MKTPELQYDPSVAALVEKAATPKGTEREAISDALSALKERDALRHALTTIALAAGLGADATAEEVAKRVGEMRGALVGWATGEGEVGRLTALARRLAEGHKLAPQPCEDPDRCGMSMRYCGPCARHLAEEAGRG